MELKTPWTMRRHRIFVHRVYSEMPLSIKTISTNSGRRTQISANSSYEINQQVELFTIWKGRSQKELTESQAFLVINNIQEGEEKIIGTIGFDFKTEKAGSKSKLYYKSASQLRHKDLMEGNGKVSYKFLGTEILQIDGKDVEDQINNRKQVLIKMQSQQKVQRETHYLEMVKLVEEKDQIIRSLQQKMISLLKETRNLHESLSKQKNKLRKTSLQKPEKQTKQPFSINVNVQSNTHELQVKKLNKQNEAMKQTIKQLHIKIEGLREHIDDVESQLDEKPSIFNIADTGQKDMLSKRVTKFVQSHYEEQKYRNNGSATSIYQQGTDTLKEDLSNMLASRAILAEDDWEKRRQKRRQERNKQRVQESEVAIEYQRKDSIEKTRKKNSQESPSKKTKTVFFQLKKDESQKTPPIQSCVTIQGATRVDQQKLRLTVHRLQEEKMTVEQKLYSKKEQTESIYRQLQRAKNREKKLDEELQSYRSMVNYYKSHGISLGEINEQQKEYLKNLARRSTLGQDFGNLAPKDKQSLIEEKLRFQMVELQDQFQTFKNQHKILIQQKDMEILKKKMGQQAEKKQKEMYLSKYRQKNEILQSERVIFQETLQKAEQLEPTLQRAKALESQVNELTAKLSKETREKNEHAGKAKKLTQMMQERQNQWQRLKNIEANYDVIKVKSSNMERANQKYSENYRDVKKFTMKMEQLVNKRPRKAINGGGDPKAEQQYQKSLQKQLNQLEAKVKNAEILYCKEQIETLTSERDLYEELYNKRIEEEKTRFNEQLVQTVDKNTIINEREKQLSDIKGDKVRQIESKIQKYTKFLQSVNTKTVPTDIGERIQQLKAKFSSQGLTIGQTVRDMKQTIQRLQRQLRSKEQELLSPRKLLKSGSSVYNSLDDRMKTRTTMMEDFMKTKQMLSKPFEDIKKINQELMKQKNMLQMEVQNGKIRQEQLNLKVKEKEKDNQRDIKKVDEQNTRKKDQQIRIHTRLSEQINKLKVENKDYQKSIQGLIDQLKSVSQTLENKEMIIGKLTDYKERLENRLKEYQQAESELIAEVEQVKHDAATNQAQFQRLFFERDEKFLKIQKLKQVQIQKLQNQIRKLEDEVQRQILEGLKLREDNDKYVEAMSEYDEQIKQIKYAEKTMEQNHTAYVEDTQIQIQALEEQNDTLQKNLVDIAQTINEKQMQIQQYKVKAQYDARRLQSLQKLQKEFKEVQEAHYVQKREAQNLIEDQVMEIKKLENNLEIIKSKIEMFASENDHYRNTNQELKDQLEELKETIHNRQSDLFQSKRDKQQLDAFLEEAEKKQIEYQKTGKQLNQQSRELKDKINTLEFQKIDLEGKIRDLQIALNQEKSKMKNLASGTDKLVRKSSRIVRKRSVLSPEVLNASRVSRSNSRRSNIGGENDDNKSKVGVRVSRQISRRVSRQPSHASGQNIQSKIMSKASKVEKNAEFGSMSIKRESDSQLKNIGGLLGMNSKPNSAADTVTMKEVEEIDQNRLGGLALPQQKTKKMQLIRKGSNVEIQVSQCESQSIDQNDIDRQIDQPIVNGHDSGESPDQGGQFFAQEDSEQFEDVAQLLDEIQLLKQERQGLLQKIEQQQEDIQGLKAELRTWKKSALEQKPSFQQEVSHGFTEELNEKLRMEQQQFGSGNVQMRPSFDKFSRSAVVQKPTKVRINRSGSRFQNNDERGKQILLDQADQQIKILQRELDQERNNVEKMIEAHKQLQDEINKANIKYRLLENDCVAIEEQLQTLKIDIEAKNQELLTEGLAKNQAIDQVNRQLTNMQKNLDEKDIGISELAAKLQQVELDNQSKANSIKNMKKEFRRYEEQGQLQILKLKEGMEKLKIEIRLKNEDMSTIGDQFLELEEKYNVSKIQLNHKESLIEGKQMEGSEMLKKYYETVDLLKQQQLMKSQLEVRVNKLMSQLTDKEQDVVVMSKESTISIKKYCIKIQSLEDETKILRKKLQDKEDLIGRLKHEVMLYNDTVQEMTKSKQSLSTQLDRVEGELKDIMHCYQGQFQQLSEAKRLTQSQVQEYSGIVRERDTELTTLNKQLANKNRQLKELANRIEQNSKAYQRGKIKSKNQVNDIFTQLQIKNDECQKLKHQLERESQAYFAKECEFMEQKEKNQVKIHQFKQKFILYEEQINELGQGLIEYANRPSVEQWQQINFQNQLYRNRITELQSNLRQQQQNSQEELIYAEFRKYKINKERELQDLQSQMERYGSKVNELQESNFFLKKEIDGVKYQLKIASNEKQKLQSLILELQSENQQMKIEVDMLKAKRAQDLGKVLDLSIS